MILPEDQTIMFSEGRERLSPVCNIMPSDYQNKETSEVQVVLSDRTNAIRISIETLEEMLKFAKSRTEHKLVGLQDEHSSRNHYVFK